MIELLKKALGETLASVDRATPMTKKKLETIDITDVKPLELASFMKENDVPDTAEFDGVENAYDGWQCGMIVLSWEIDVPTTEEDRLKYRKKRFNSRASSNVFKLLRDNGYKRTTVNSREFAQFDDTTLYDMYISGDFDRLVKYYSLNNKLN